MCSWVSVCDFSPACVACTRVLVVSARRSELSRARQSAPARWERVAKGGCGAGTARSHLKQRSARPATRRVVGEEHDAAHSGLVIRVQDDFAHAAVVPPPVQEQQPLKELELRDRKIRGIDGLPARRGCVCARLCGRPTSGGEGGQLAGVCALVGDQRLVWPRPG